MKSIITHNDLRKTYSKFWEKREHKEVPPIPLVLENDPTTLFNGSGMQQLIPYLLGEPHPLGTRLYNIQRSFRTQDIEEVGDNRHTTFFEMMGNWSLGDYFKEDQIAWFWEFLTKNLALPKAKLWVTVFEGNAQVPKDEESANLWKKLGVSQDHLFYYGANKNWWSRSGEPGNMPPGEIGGPDSEVFFEFTDIPHNKKFGSACHPNCDCGRFLEIGNSVFIQYKKLGNGKLEELPKKNVDFGGGLERLLAAANNDPDVFKTDVLWPIIDQIQIETEKSYEDEEYKAPMRIIADHLRASTFLICDGVVPSNKEQGYVLRRLMRRSAVMLHKLGGVLTPMPVIESIFNQLISKFIDPYFGADEGQKRSLIEGIITRELNSFGEALNRGLKKIEKTDPKMIDAQFAFDLYQSFGFPFEVLQELLSQRKITITREGFDKVFDQHKQASKKGLEKKFRGGLADHSEQTVKYHTATHLLHQALRSVLGTHVQQKGSNITQERLRFDFSHPEKMSDVKIKHVEKIVNEQIGKHLPVSKEIATYEEAIKKGALAFFGERYPEKVNIYSIGSFSKEICGGPHVQNTKELGHFNITKESSAGAGIRRIYAILE